MKTHFDLDHGGDKKRKGDPYVSIEINGVNMLIKDKDLERFAVNILKALKTKKLK